MNSLTHLGSRILNYINEQGSFGISIILGIEEAGVPLPIPGDLILAFAGYKISIGQLTWWQAFSSSVIGVTIGASILYWTFRLGGRPFVDKYGKFILLPKSRVTQLEHWFLKRGNTAILIGRFVPGFRVFISGVAGLVKLNYLIFLSQVIVASSVWVILFLIIGYYMGEKWGNMTDIFEKYGLLFFVIFIGSILISLRKSSKNMHK